MRRELVKLSAPFLVSQILYWKLFYIPTDQPGLWTAFIKCLPVSTLALYLGNSNSKDSLVQGLFWGMIFSIGSVQLFVNLICILNARWRFKIV